MAEAHASMHRPQSAVIAYYGCAEIICRNWRGRRCWFFRRRWPEI